MIFEIEAECKKLIQTCNSNYSKDLYQVIVGYLEKAKGVSFWGVTLKRNAFIYINIEIF